MSIRRNRSLDDVLNWIWRDKYQNIAEKLNPIKMEKGYIIPFYGPEKSMMDLNLKMVALGIYRSDEKQKKQVDIFKSLNQKEKDFIAYNLSHELKIASMAAAVALENENINVFEIGPAFGFSSLHFARLISKKSKTVRLVTIERKKESVDKAEEMRKCVKGVSGDIKFIHGDGVIYLNNHLKDGDIVFSSIAPPNVMNGILDLLNRKSFNLIVSYSEEISNKITSFRGRTIDNIIRSYNRNAIFFEDEVYNQNITWDFSKFAFLSRYT
jgi:hypothetical protein